MACGGSHSAKVQPAVLAGAEYCASRANEWLCCCACRLVLAVSLSLLRPATMEQRYFQAAQSLGTCTGDEGSLHNRDPHWLMTKSC